MKTDEPLFRGDLESDVEDGAYVERTFAVKVQKTDLNAVKRLGHVHKTDLKPVYFFCCVVETDLSAVNIGERRDVSEECELQACRARLGFVVVEKSRQLDTDDGCFLKVYVRETCNLKSTCFAVGEVENTGKADSDKVLISDVTDASEVESVDVAVMAPKSAQAYASNRVLVRRKLKGWHETHGERSDRSTGVRDDEL